VRAAHGEARRGREMGRRGRGTSGARKSGGGGLPELEPPTPLGASARLSGGEEDLPSASARSRLNEGVREGFVFERFRGRAL
jgi:hypothetical protein